MAGFTLVELLVVLAMFSLVALVGIPWLVKFGQRNQFRSAAFQIQTTLLAARMRAVKRNLPASVLIVTALPSVASHVLNTTEAEPPAPTPTPNPVARLEIPARALRFLSLPTGGKITFDGNGRRIVPPAPTPGSIVIEGPVGAGVTNQITIQTSLTGRVQVITPVVWQ